MTFALFRPFRASLVRERRRLQAELDAHGSRIGERPDLSDAQKLALLRQAVFSRSPRIAELDRRILARTGRRQLRKRIAGTPPGMEKTTLELELMRRRPSPLYLRVGAAAIYVLLGLIALAFYLVSSH